MNDYTMGQMVRVTKCNDAGWVGREVRLTEPNPKFANAVDPEKFAYLMADGAKAGFYLSWKFIEPVK